MSDYTLNIILYNMTSCLTNYHHYSALEQLSDYLTKNINVNIFKNCLYNVLHEYSFYIDNDLIQYCSSYNYIINLLKQIDKMIQISKKYNWKYVILLFNLNTNLKFIRIHI